MLAKHIAQETVEALDRGTYKTPNGAVVDIASLLRRCVDETRCFDPDALTRIRQQVLAKRAKWDSTSFEVLNETTLEGCARLVENHEYQRIGALNFASAKNPGGGFLGGAHAQEESLARSSGLYKSLLQCPAHYAFHRTQNTCFYSDRMIYSPNCPVLRTDDGDWLKQPYIVDFITSPAPNAGAILKNEHRKLDQIVPVLNERSSKILALAAHQRCDVVVLGAWGCGVFHNDPKQVASAFWEHLNPEGPYWGRFQKVLFSVYDKLPRRDTYKAFAERFAD